MSVGRVCASHGYDVLYHPEVLLPGAKDEVVCEAALRNSAVLIAQDGDMKSFARRYSVTPSSDRFNRLCVIRLCCNEVQAAKRVAQLFDLIDVEWAYTKSLAARRLWIDVMQDQVRIYR